MHIQTIRVHLEEKGMKKSLFCAFRRLKKAVYLNDQYFYGKISLNSIPPITPELPLTIRETTMGDLKKIDVKYEDFKNWLGPGYIFKVAEYNGEVIAYISLKKAEPERPFNERIKLDTDEVWLVHTYTSPRYRGKRISPYMINNISQELIANGYKKLVLVVNTKNFSAKKSHEKAGFKAEREVSHKRIFSQEIITLNKLLD